MEATLNVELRPKDAFPRRVEPTGPPGDEPPRRSQEGHGVLFGLTAAVIWGGYLVATRYGIGAGLSAYDMAFLRYATAGLLLLPWLLLHAPWTLSGAGWIRGLVLALLAGPAFVLVGASGFYYAPLAHSAVIQLGCVTLMGILLSALVVGEKPGRKRVAGVVVIIAGLLITAGPAVLTGGSDAWKGDLLFAGAGTMWALFTVLQRRWRIEALTATAVVSVASGLTFTPLYLAMHGPSNLLLIDPIVVIGLVIVLGLFSGVVALFAFGRAIEALGSSRASIFPALAPSVAIILGIPVSSELPTALQVLGLIVLSMGLLLALSAPCRAPLRDSVP